MLQISLPATNLLTLGSIPITDGFLGALVVSILLIVFLVASARRFARVPTRPQAILEMLVDYIEEQLEAAFHSKARARAFLPFYVTLLLFLVVANQLSLFPLIFEITHNGFDVFRQPTSDFSGPMALSLLIAVISHVMAFKISPMKHLSNFIAIKPLLQARAPMEVFQGLVGIAIGGLNIIGEFAKVVSLSARLFGNIFAGNIMLAVIMSLAALTQFVVPLPFLVLSTLSGFIQAYVFMLLGVQFVAATIDGATPESTEPDSSVLPDVRAEAAF